MIYSLQKYSLYVFLCLIISLQAFSQLQVCPSNINFSAGDISNWSAVTGLTKGGAQNYPLPNTGVSTIPEYTISKTGIQVITTSTLDPFGGFPTIPTINGYSYNYSIMLGSTATSHDLSPGGGRNGNPGGFTRAVTYIINVPAGSTAVPYTMTYAYAMVLENGTHNSNEQPLAKATLSTSAGIINCASPSYYLPTLNNAMGGNGSSGTGATLDSAKAIANGFSNSPVPFLSFSGNGNGTLLYDVWTKGWTEVTFDLSPYRGQQVTLTFEADNCQPGAHFAYAYIALRDVCSGLQISGYPEACSNTVNTYSIPALAGGTYQWTVPPGWNIVSGTDTTSILKVVPGNTGGTITVRERNSCADLTATLAVTVRPPTIAGNIISDNEVCEGMNSTTLTLTGERGNILNWLSSTNGIRWNTVSNTTATYTAQNLNTTTIYKALVQNGSSCSIDTSGEATITVDSKSVGGQLNPADMNFCLGQYKDATLTLKGKYGNVLRWESSQDAINWSNFNPSVDTTYDIPSNTTQSTQYRVIVKNGVCPNDTSSIANVHVFPVAYPQQTIYPKDTTICYDDTAQLNSLVTIGTSYTWTNSKTLTGTASGTILETPSVLTNEAHPLNTTTYILSILNAGCPNALRDTFRVQVMEPVLVNAGNDTAIVYNQPLQLQAQTNYTSGVSFNWSPATGLDNTEIFNPVARLGINVDSVRYRVTVTTTLGCYNSDDLLVRVFKTLPDIFVPNAFTPGRGTNSLFRPIPVGIVSLDYFRVYNRWGQLVYSSPDTRSGWDGTIKGIPQGSNSFVWIAQGKDYTGKTVIRKGTMVLIR